MKISTLRVRLLVRDSRSLKDKRQVVRSILDRIKGSWNVSAAEVGHLDDLRVIEIGVAAVGPNAELPKTAVQQISEALRGHPIAEFLGCEFDVHFEDS